VAQDSVQWRALVLAVTLPESNLVSWLNIAERFRWAVHTSGTQVCVTYWLENKETDLLRVDGRIILKLILEQCGLDL